MAFVYFSRSSAGLAFAFAMQQPRASTVKDRGHKNKVCQGFLVARNATA